MSTRQLWTEGSDTSFATQTTDAPSAPTCILQSQWHQERLTEARVIVADIAHHPDTLVVLACRAICAHSSDTLECADAQGLIRLLCACAPYSPSKPWRVGS
jgi:hypothetical protein